MSDEPGWGDEEQRAIVAGITALSQLGPFLDTLDGMVREIQGRGFTAEQARAMVAYFFGYRPPPVEDGA